MELYRDSLCPVEAANLFAEHRKPVKLFLEVEYGLINIHLDNAASLNPVVFGEAQHMPFPLLNELITEKQAIALSTIFRILDEQGIKFTLDKAYMHHELNMMMFYQDDLKLALSLSRNPVKLSS